MNSLIESVTTDLQHLCKLSSGHIGIDVEDLTFCVLRQTGEDGQAAGFDSCLDWCFINPSDLADETVLGFVEVLGSEDTSGDGPGTSAESLESSGQFEVLLQENALLDEHNSGR